MIGKSHTLSVLQYLNEKCGTCMVTRSMTFIKPVRRSGGPQVRPPPIEIRRWKYISKLSIIKEKKLKKNRLLLLK